MVQNTIQYAITFMHANNTGLFNTIDLSYTYEFIKK